MALKCPLCGATTAFQPAVTEQQALLVGSSTPTKRVYANVLAQAIHNEDQGTDWYAICKCQDCNRLFIASRDDWYSYEPWKPVWPLPAEAGVAKGVPTEDVRLAFEDAEKCLAVEAYGGCLLMCRTTIERLQRDRKVSGLKELMEKGEISSMLYGQADEVRYWANMVAHDDFDQKALTPEALTELMAYIEELLNAV